MRYMLLLYADESAGAATTQEEAGKLIAAFAAYSDALQKAGVAVPQGMDRLESTRKARTVRVRDAKAKVLDGPFAETKEQFAGFFIIDVPTEEDAVEWAKRCPGATYGSVEVRPMFEMPG